MQVNKKTIHLNIQNLTKKFGDISVLQDVELAIKEGEFVAVVGRSGCGKSTLLRLIAGLEQPTEGNVYLNDHVVDGINAETRVLFQEARLLPWKKVLKNVQIGAVNKNEEIARAALREVGLVDRINEWPYVLSGGQKQRVALARALAADPKLLLLDEPLGALDALTRIEMQQLIERLWVQKQFTVVLVTHDVSEAVALADRVIFIDQGKIGMDVRITLDRPRVRDNDFMYFEKYILDRVMSKQEDYEGDFQKKKVEYSI
ncbi:ATP-binding cassette domain-containing protein [Pelosinus sp. UFO1]|jgi:sulfonate transport system ATP-binding protein|uniref:ATP-binding cassette domain-containing protein n=1 Tax=Pelosinus sp. UFO1 TaxID=484770 RepID=UPI0004D18B98|nr:ATP-binding cassette domain-containing protein [Pelosinus sp. UFO1]AIF52361.1 Taurine-transporting ATPase [Pelosinus sp. UFO1]